MKKQYGKRMFAQLIFYSLLLNIVTPYMALARTDTQSTECDQNITRSERKKHHNRPHNPCCPKPCKKEKDKCKKKKNHCKKEKFDFVIVGAGQAGCVLANRLSESGEFTVCVLEAGRDDARESELLPEPSPANVPQPGDYNWGKYNRGGSPFNGAQLNRGFGSWWYYEQTDRPNGFNSTTYTRGAQWGGCSSHNNNIDVRNAPYNWNQWVALGLTDWDASTPASPLVPIYKKIENRSQAIIAVPPTPGSLPLYNPALAAGEFGGFDPAWYGFDGEIPLVHGFPDEFTPVLQEVVGTTLSSFDYPLAAPGVAALVDLDYPPTAMFGGLSILNATLNFQVLNATITEPGNAPAPGDFANNVPFAVYNFPKYGDTGFKVPQEYQDLNDPTLDPAALQLLQRVSSANTYLYDAQNRPNLTIKSEVLVTNLILKDNQAKGVEYLEGWNIYQTGRNPNTSQAGYGGTRGDARFNGVAAKKKDTCKVYAKKAVILCAGSFNTPQILNLSGIGNKFDLEPMGIESKLHLPGVGQHLLDSTELFLVWQKAEGAINSFLTFNTLSTFVNPTDRANGIPPAFDLLFVAGSLFFINCESTDPFVQKFWSGLRNVPAIYSTNTRNTFHNILLDTTNPTANPGPITVTSAAAPVAPTPPDTGPWSVTFTIPASIVSSGGFTVEGNSNPNYNGKFTASAFNGLPTVTRNNVPGVTTITLLYPTNPGVFGGGVTTITGDAAFLPIMVDPNNILGLLLEQEQDNLSEGFVKLVSSDPTVPPFIHMPYLEHPHDLQVWIDVMNNTVFPVWTALKATSPAYFEKLLFPSPEDILLDGVVEFNSIADVDQAKLRTFLLNYTGGHHAMGTCKMGVVGDPLAVVDQNGKVFGMQDLYIADMSVTPVSARWPNGVCYVIAEKIAQDILAAYS
ncbi:MAG: GMC family oxidoreductase [Candidatus Babeliales bacterium]